MGKKIITSLYEFVMTQPAPVKPEVDQPTKPGIPPAPSRPGRAIPDREPNPNEEERPMAEIMKNIKGSISKEKGTILAKSLVKKLEKLAELGVNEL
jgi:hypothetical protein